MDLKQKEKAEKKKINIDFLMANCLNILILIVKIT